MKKLSLIVAVALGGLVACSIATAQEAGKDAAKKGRRGPTIEQLTTQLDLTAEQKPKVQAVLDDTAKKTQDLTQEERRGEKGQAIRKEQTAKMKAILTDEQFKKYQEMGQRGKKGGGKKAEKKSE
jgi:periplasmic protein CpxP/Spy